MLLIPFDRKIDWSNPPVITLLLLAANCLVFVLFQLDDYQEIFTAEQTYQTSGLQEIERPYYLNYLKQKQGLDIYLDEPLATQEEGQAVSIMWMVQTDSDFQKLLAEGRIIAPSSEIYQAWHSKRQAFEEKYEAITFVSYGLRTERPSIVTLFSHMFLHGGVWHLLGNSIFLLAVGFLVELTLGRTIYLLAYLVSGLGSAGFSFVFGDLSLIPGIGASGAISGLMGMYAVLYGLRRVRFFYSIGIYFDYVSLPAIMLLPMWIGNEVVQYLLYSDVSNINYLAHLGGLVTGACVAYALKTWSQSFNTDFMDEESAQNDFEQKLEQARMLCEGLEYQKALPKLRMLYPKRPENRELLCLYHSCSRLNPQSDEYHKLTHAIFALSDVDIGTNNLVLDTYREYREVARPKPRLSYGMVCRLAERFIRSREVKEADHLIKLILKSGPSRTAGNSVVLAYIDLLERTGSTQSAARYRQYLNAAIEKAG